VAEIDNDPDAPNRTIARRVHGKYPLLSKSVENTRNHVRHVRGNNGNRSRQFSTRPRPNGKAGEVVVKMPRSHARDRLPFIMPAGNVLVISDLHVPYHSEDAIEAALNWRDDFDMILINGDFMDFHHLSTFVKDAKAARLAEEVEAGRQMLDYLASYGRPIFFKEGNHDERLVNYMYMRAPDVGELDLWRIDKLLDFEKHGITHIGDKRRVVVAEHLNVLHGHELTRGIAAPVNPARGAFLRSKVCTLVGHSHKTSQHDESTLDGTLIACWSTGCLCELSPYYSPYSGWNHGFAFVEVDENGFTVHNKKIIKGKVH